LGFAVTQWRQNNPIKVLGKQQEYGLQKYPSHPLQINLKKLKLIFEIAIAIEFLIFVQIRILC
jgi:hypothetical protein